MSHLKSSAQTMRIALWSWERNEGTKKRLRGPPSIHKASHCNSIPRDRRCIYFRCIPSYFGVLKAHPFACPCNQNKRSRCSYDLFLIPALVGVPLRSVNMDPKYSSGLAALCFAVHWRSALSVLMRKSHVWRQNLECTASRLSLLVQNGCCRPALHALQWAAKAELQRESTASRRLLLCFLAPANLSQRKALLPESQMIFLPQPGK